MATVENPQAAPNPYTARATHYYSEEQLLALEVVMLKLRTKHKIKIGKSELARLAMDRMLAMDLDDLAEAARPYVQE